MVSALRPASRGVNVRLWHLADVADPSITQGDTWRNVLRLTAQTLARREAHSRSFLGTVC